MLGRCPGPAVDEEPGRVPRLDRRLGDGRTPAGRSRAPAVSMAPASVPRGVLRPANPGGGPRRERGGAPARPRWAKAAAVATRPRGVRMSSPPLDQEGLVDVLDGLGLLPHADGEGGQATGPPPKRSQIAERMARSTLSRPSSSTPKVARPADAVGRSTAPSPFTSAKSRHATQEAVGDPRRASSPPGDLPGALGIDGDPEDARGTGDDVDEVLGARSSRAGRPGRSGRGAGP